MADAGEMLEAEPMVRGTETEELDVELLAEACSGDIEAIGSVCGHYRGRLLILAGNAGADHPDQVVQRALTESLLQLRSVRDLSLVDFEQHLFRRVVAESDPLVPVNPVNPVNPLNEANRFGPVPVISVPDEPTVEFTQPIAVAEPMLGAVPPAAGGGLVLNPEPSPVDWSVLDVGPPEVGPTLAPPSNRLVAGGVALLCGIGVIAAMVLFLAGDDDATGDVGQQALASGEPASANDQGSESVGGTGALEPNRSSGPVTANPSPSGPSTTVSNTASSEPQASTASTSPPSTTPPTTQAPTTQAPTTVAPTTVAPPTTIAGNFAGQRLDDVSFRDRDFRNFDFTGATLSNVVFSRANLAGVSFADATLIDVRFSQSNLAGADFGGARMEDTNIEDSDISGTDFRRSVMRDGDIDAFWSDPEPIGRPRGERRLDR